MIYIKQPDKTEFDELIQLLSSCELPFDDLTPEHLDHYLVAYQDAQLVGAVGLELYGEVGLLRSLAVHSTYRGTGLGSELVDLIETYAGKLGVRNLYLLTTTAENYFARWGYRIIDRDQAPKILHATAEFSALCPSTAVCLTKDLEVALLGRQVNMPGSRKGFLFAALVGAIVGGVFVAIVTRAIPRIISGMMQEMMTNMRAAGCSPGEI